jgi:ABC-2 type transport system ATP-binding protein
MAILSAQNISIRIGRKYALWDVSLEIDYGEIVGVFGRSDSGKTVLARVLSGLDEPTSGKVTFGADGAAAAKWVSVALSTPAAASELTVYENLEMFASLWGVSRKKRGREIAYLLELLSLAEQRSRRVYELSSGARARLEIARALVADAPLTVIDSLLDSLDLCVREKLWEYFLTLRRNEHKSFVIMSSSSRVVELCGRIIALNNGRIAYVGRPDDFRSIAGDDMVVLGDLTNPALRSRIAERLSVVIQEEEGFLSFRVANGDRVVSDLLAEFGSEVGCVYLKRPTLDDALDVLSSGSTSITATLVDGNR